MAMISPDTREKKRSHKRKRKPYRVQLRELLHENQKPRDTPPPNKRRKKVDQCRAGPA
jgi:hypothetical protein